MLIVESLTIIITSQCRYKTGKIRKIETRKLRKAPKEVKRLIFTDVEGQIIAYIA